MMRGRQALVCSVALGVVLGSVWAGGTAGVTPQGARAGAMIATVTVDPYAVAVAVDEGTNRVFVASLAKTDAFGNPTGPGTLSVLDATSGVRLRTARIAQDPQAIAADTTTRRAFVLCLGKTDKDGNPTGNGVVQTFDAGTGMLLHTTTIGQGTAPEVVGLPPRLLAVDKRTARVFAVNEHSGTVSVLDGRTGVLIATVKVGNIPKAVALDERRGRVFVANSLDYTVSVLDAGSGKVLHTVAVGTNPIAVATDEETGRAFVVNVPAPGSPSVSVLDSVTARVVRTAQVGANPMAVAVDERTARAFVVNYNDGTKPGSVTMLDATTGMMRHITRLGPGPEALAVDSRDGRVFVVGNLVLSVLDAATGTLRGTVSTQSAGPIAVDEGTGRVFVANDNSFGVVSVLDARVLSY